MFLFCWSDGRQRPASGRSYIPWSHRSRSCDGWLHDDVSNDREQTGSIAQRRGQSMTRRCCEHQEMSRCGGGFAALPEGATWLANPRDALGRIGQHVDPCPIQTAGGLCKLHGWRSGGCRTSSPAGIRRRNQAIAWDITEWVCCCLVAVSLALDGGEDFLADEVTSWSRWLELHTRLGSVEIQRRPSVPIGYPYRLSVGSNGWRCSWWLAPE